MTYLSSTQRDQLIKAINPKRVGTDGKGFSHVEAYEIRAHLNRVFGFARWSADVLSQEVVFESSAQRRKKNQQGVEYGDPYEAWTVCYRSTLRLTVSAPDGTFLASYTEGATGEATNQPGRGDAHDLAAKTSASQALKRCASNLGDQFGLSLYKKGSRDALVLATLLDGDEPVGDHVTESIPESTEVDKTGAPAVALAAASLGVPEEALESISGLRDEALALWAAREQGDPKDRIKTGAALLNRINRLGVSDHPVTDEQGAESTLRALALRCTRQAVGAA